MQVLLRSDVAGIGRRGDIVTVSSGHARNFLLPKGLAVEASEGTVAQAAAMQRARSAREAADRESAQTIAASLAQRAVTITAKAGAEGRLFGSVTANDIVTAVDEQFGISLERTTTWSFAVPSLSTRCPQVKPAMPSVGIRSAVHDDQRHPHLSPRCPQRCSPCCEQHGTSRVMACQ